MDKQNSTNNIRSHGRHPRESGDPISPDAGKEKLDSRFRGNDGERDGNDGERDGNDGERDGNDGERDGNDGERDGNDGERDGNDGERDGNDGERGGNDGEGDGNDGERGGDGGEEGGDGEENGKKIEHRKKTKKSSLQTGVAILNEYLKTLPNKPGVYRMLNSEGEVLYVGKAKNLKKRVASYARPGRLSNRLQNMVSRIRSMEFVITYTETEALLLEANLIKEFSPHYNILLRDDKSFPYILITGEHKFPALIKYRGVRTGKGFFFGPFASTATVNETLGMLHRVFMLRNCSDSFFAARTRPCLQYHIKRCTAPCVSYVSEEDYAEQVRAARAFLSGRDTGIQEKLSQEMQKASDALDFEKAALLRDRIKALTAIQSRQAINIRMMKDADVIAAYQAGGQTCVQVFFFRAGHNNGNCSFFPKHDAEATAEEVLEAFVAQFYTRHAPPELVLVSHELAEKEEVAAALSSVAGYTVEISKPVHSDRARIMEQAIVNAREALERRMAESATQHKLLAAMKEKFGLGDIPKRIEVYDNSHISGTNPVGAMIVAGPDGFIKGAYRKFNIKSITGPPASPGDDYAMMREVLTRRFEHDNEDGKWELPDVLLIDGGRGHINVALDVLTELGVEGPVVIAIAKGRERRAGRERFFMSDGRQFSLMPRDPVLHYLQRLRDEAHRFAIGTHRQKRSKAMIASPLDEIAGIGSSRKKALLHHFGSAKAVASAGLSDLEAVKGISKAMAKKVYEHFRAG